MASPSKDHVHNTEVRVPAPVLYATKLAKMIGSVVQKAQGAALKSQREAKEQLAQNRNSSDYSDSKYYTRMIVALSLESQFAPSGRPVPICIAGTPCCTPEEPLLLVRWDIKKTYMICEAGKQQTHT